MSYQEVKCNKCSWVHLLILAADAKAQVNLSNRHFEAQGFTRRETLEPDLKCFRCSSPTSKFVLAGPGDAPAGCTLQAVVMQEPPSAQAYGRTDDNRL